MLMLSSNLWGWSPCVKPSSIVNLRDSAFKKTLSWLGWIVNFPTLAKGSSQVKRSCALKISWELSDLEVTQIYLDEKTLKAKARPNTVPRKVASTCHSISRPNTVNVKLTKTGNLPTCTGQKNNKYNPKNISWNRYTIQKKERNSDLEEMGIAIPTN